MTIEVQDAGGPPPRPRAGRPSVYPFATMDVGGFFFVPNKDHNTVSSHAYSRGRKFGRKFATRLQWMTRTQHGWELAEPETPGAVKGVGVYRTE